MSRVLPLGCIVALFVVALVPACASEDAAGGDAGASDAASVDDPALDEARAYNLEKINALRASDGQPPLRLDDALNAFAQAASVELSMDHKPHRYFADHAGECKCSLFAEVQGDPSGWPASPVHQQIDQILEAMISEGPGGGHHDAILSPKATRLGVGLVHPGGELFFTNDFGT